MISRRDFLKDISLATLAAGSTHQLLALAAGADNAETSPGKEGMILRSFRFLDLEMPMEFVNSWITPVSHFFVRNHMFEPTSVDAAEWRPFG